VSSAEHPQKTYRGTTEITGSTSSDPDPDKAEEDQGGEGADAG